MLAVLTGAHVVHAVRWYIVSTQGRWSMCGVQWYTGLAWRHCFASVVTEIKALFSLQKKLANIVTI